MYYVFSSFWLLMLLFIIIFDLMRLVSSRLWDLNVYTNVGRNQPGISCRMQLVFICAFEEKKIKKSIHSSFGAISHFSHREIQYFVNEARSWCCEVLNWTGIIGYPKRILKFHRLKFRKFSQDKIDLLKTWIVYTLESIADAFNSKWCNLWRFI